MHKSVRNIVIIIIVIGVVVLVILRPEFIGQSFAALAGGFAAFKAKLFNSSRINVEEEMASIEMEHTIKRKNWELMREEYDSKFEALKARMDYLDYKSATIAKQIGNLDMKEKEAIKKNTKLTDDELLNWLKN
ncbi:MAG: hypothetical protein AAFY41_00185 [Bacteroidota bacterium]